MITATCSVTLLNDANNRSVDIKLTKADDGKLSWELVESTKGSLILPGSKGAWFNYSFADILSLTYTPEGKKDSEGGLFLVAYKVKSDFLNDIAQGKTVVTDDAELYGKNPTERKVTCKIWNGR